MALDAAVAVMSQAPTPTSVKAPVDASTVHTVVGVAEYDRVVWTPPGAVTAGAVPPKATEAEL